MLSLQCKKFLSVSIQNAMKARVIVLKTKFDGLPKPENFQLIEENLRPITNGEFLVQAEYISVDPYQRIYPPKIGNTVTAEQVAKIIDSQNPNFPVGAYVIGEWGWRSHSIATEQPGKFLQQTPKILQGYENLSRSLALGVAGMPGVAAYFGLLNVCRATKGNTVLVSGAAGAVGNIVGQIAKIKECKAIGITSSDEKGQRLVSEVGYDGYVNYNSKTFKEDLAKAAPDGFDCYFDNVGGEISSTVLGKMKKFGHVAVCGSISTYNDSTKKSLASEVQTPVKVQHLTMEGFSVVRWTGQWEEAIQNNLTWVKQGRLKPLEYVVQGFENTPDAFMALFTGKNFGKTIVKV